MSLANVGSDVVSAERRLILLGRMTSLPCLPPSRASLQGRLLGILVDNHHNPLTQGLDMAQQS